MPSSSTSNAATRWNLVISEQTNVAVRSFLARRGFKKGDLSSFVEEAVRWRVFDQMLGQAREGLDGLAAMAAENLLDEALSEVRDEGLASARYAAFQFATPPMEALQRRLHVAPKISLRQGCWSAGGYHLVSTQSQWPFATRSLT